jgi:hypothetical protein
MARFAALCKGDYRMTHLHFRDGKTELPLSFSWDAGERDQLTWTRDECWKNENEAEGRCPRRKDSPLPLQPVFVEEAQAGTNHL